MAHESPLFNSPHSLPHFLRKFHVSEIKGADHTSPQVVILGVHSVFLESGFVSYDPASKIDGIRPPEGWTSTLSASPVPIPYTLTALLNSERNSAVDSVVLNFQFLANSVVVYGCLNRRGSNLVRLFLDASRFVPSIEFFLKNAENGSLEAAHERVVFEFWKTVKDGLSLPLLISICDAAGLPSPPCFMVLPIDVKLRILEFLPGIDVARTACVCSELRYLASNDELWRRKRVEEFGELCEEKSSAGQWKQNSRCIGSGGRSGNFIEHVVCISSLPLDYDMALFLLLSGFPDMIGSRQLILIIFMAPSVFFLLLFLQHACVAHWHKQHFSTLHYS